jgi:uncharacterized membrane protein
MASVGVLIYFIHHSAESIQAENVIAAVSRELHQAIERLYPECLGHDPPKQLTGADSVQLPDRFEREAQSIASPRSGYLQAIDVDRLLRLAKDRDIVCLIEQRPGKFCFKGDDLLRFWPNHQSSDELGEKVLGSFYFGTRRTLAQDIEFAIDQLVEVSVRALSPGVNDPFTAINCVDRLGTALCTLTERAIPSRYRYDDDGKLRIVTAVSTIAGIVNAAFDQIRQAARHDTAVTLRILESIGAVARHTRDEEFRTALRRQAEAVHRGSRDGLRDQIDREEADQRFQSVIKSLEGVSNTA